MWGRITPPPCTKPPCPPRIWYFFRARNMGRIFSPAGKEKTQGGISLVFLVMFCKGHRVNRTAGKRRQKASDIPPQKRRKRRNPLPALLVLLSVVNVVGMAEGWLFGGC